MPQPPVAIATSAYGADLIRRLGQAHVLPVIARAGAACIEIRRELFGEAPPAELPALRRAVALQGLHAVYSVPLELWRADGGFEADALRQVRGEATALEARLLKVSLGHWGAGQDLQPLADVLAEPGVPLVIENDQTPQGGRPEPIAEFLARCAAAGLPVGLTFDIGNWRWTGSDAAEAAALLGGHVRYVHCKAVREEGGKLCAVPPAAAELREAWPPLFARFRPGVMRAIEYPLAGDDLTALSAEGVAALRAL